MTGIQLSANKIQNIKYNYGAFRMPIALFEFKIVHKGDEGIRSLRVVLSITRLPATHKGDEGIRSLRVVLSITRLPATRFCCELGGLVFYLLSKLLSIVLGLRSELAPFEIRDLLHESNLPFHSGFSDQSCLLSLEISNVLLKASPLLD
ncbi:hypothetical protein DCAR_0311920 [Daucus carota subsp. sativus]|uniref:Uncharacterized protein n=1 Tax=Daucus carota subsp. sativus TaxID=79200 RepID=A0AAF0WNT3_DAUCS|nr:hypothetical protein DCAR_0311920 [Daucus carota subsp. sativus]